MRHDQGWLYKAPFPSWGNLQGCTVQCESTSWKTRTALTICSSPACTDILVMLWVTLYSVFNDFMGIWENIQSFIVEILHFGLGTNTSNLVLYKTDWELVSHPFYSSKNYSHHNKVAVEFMIIYSKWKQGASGIPSLVLFSLKHQDS